MTEKILEQIFNSPARVRLLRLFLRNPETYFSLADVVSKTQIERRTVKKQIDVLQKIGFFKKKVIKKKPIRKKTGKKNKKKPAKRAAKTATQKPGIYFSANSRFVFYEELRALILKSSPASLDKVSKQIRGLGRVKLAVLSGVFMNADNCRVDLFIVGDNISVRKLTSFLKRIEAEIGRPINYSILTTKDFAYRYGMFDRFILDILEGPHKKVINKLKID